MHVELRVRAFNELCIYKSQYLSDAFLKELTGLDGCIDKLFNGSFDTSSKVIVKVLKLAFLTPSNHRSIQICGTYLH